MLNQISEAISAQFVTRLLIISYFVAVALGLIVGIDVARLAEPFLPELMARYLMRAVVLTLCGMVLFDVLRRPAALVLALIVFWASYITLYSGGEIGPFWRDLALIGGLLLTANITDYADRALAEDWDDADEAGVGAYGTENQQSDMDLEGDGGQFREDFDIVRAT